MNIEMKNVVKDLLATLPQCHACERPATRMMMSQHVPLPGWHTCEKGKNFSPRPYNGPSMGAHLHNPTDGTWQWDCCDDHAMPEPMGTWDKPLAKTVRVAQMYLRNAENG